MQLTNRKAVITGASQGLGFHIAEAFVKQGAAVTLCARNQAQLNAAEHQLKEHFPNASIASECDNALMRAAKLNTARPIT